MAANEITSVEDIVERLREIASRWSEGIESNPDRGVEECVDEIDSLADEIERS